MNRLRNRLTRDGGNEWWIEATPIGTNQSGFSSLSMSPHLREVTKQQLDNKLWYFDKSWERIPLTEELQAAIWEKAEEGNDFDCHELGKAYFKSIQGVFETEQEKIEIWNTIEFYNNGECTHTAIVTSISRGETYVVAKMWDDEIYASTLESNKRMYWDEIRIIKSN